jgi:hypothetical protein
MCNSPKPAGQHRRSSGRLARFQGLEACLGVRFEHRWMPLTGRR